MNGIKIESYTPNAQKGSEPHTRAQTPKTKDLVDIASNLEGIWGHTDEVVKGLLLLSQWLENTDPQESATLSVLASRLQQLRGDLRTELDEVFAIGWGMSVEPTQEG